MADEKEVNIQSEPKKDVKDVIAEQKAQCPFCKIVSGEIPATSVYDDDKIMVICDINPLTKGHLLVFPKEHYPILPFVPPEILQHLFETIKFISKGAKDYVVTDSVNIFLANGGAAGQQSPHFLVHVIPREPGDTIDSFIQKPGKIDEQKAEQFKKLMQANIEPFLAKFAKRSPHKNEEKTDKSQPSKEKSQPKSDENTDSGIGNRKKEEVIKDVPKKISDEQKKKLAEFIENNEAIKEMLVDDPNKLLEKMATDKELAALFDGVDVIALSTKLQAVYKEQEKQ